MRNDSAQTRATQVNITKGGSHKPSIKARAIDQIKRFLIMTLYLWAFFATLSLHRTIILEQEHISYQEQGLAIVNALVLAKVMLIAQDLHLGTRFKDTPLIHSVLYNSAAFSVVLICFHIVEQATIALLNGKPLVDSLADFGSRDLKGILSVGAIAFVALIPFFMFTELGRVLGSDKLRQLVLTRRRKAIALVVLE